MSGRRWPTASTASWASVCTRIFTPIRKSAGWRFLPPGPGQQPETGGVPFANITKETGLTARSIKANKELVFPREVQMPSTLVEMGFLSNYQEEELLRKSEFREKLAAGLFRGILHYLGGE